MKITFLGQAGFLIETAGKKIVVDPYLSNSVEKIQPQNKRRQIIDKRFLEIIPDMIIITHNHLDHFDMETLKYYFSDKLIYISPYSVWKELKTEITGNNILISENGEWTEDYIRVKAVKAYHSDSYALGYILYIENKKLYIVGDSIYNSNMFSNIDKDIDVLFIPINGKGNNMNKLDAARFSEKIKAKYVVPMHFGMFDAINAEDFNVKNKIIPKIYEEIKI